MILVVCKRFTSDDPFFGSGNRGWFFLLAHEGFEGDWSPSSNYDSQPVGAPWRAADTPENDVRDCVSGVDY